MTGETFPVPARSYAARSASLAILEAIRATRPLSWAEAVAWTELDGWRRRYRSIRALRLPVLIDQATRRLAAAERRRAGRDDRHARSAVERARVRLEALRREAAELANG
jgi:hypothetical protein